MKKIKLLLFKQFSSRILLERTVIQFLVDWIFLGFICFGIFSKWIFFNNLPLGWQSFLFGGIFAFLKFFIQEIIYSTKDTEFINVILSENEQIYNQKFKTTSYFIKELFYCWIAFAMLFFGDIVISQKSIFPNIWLAILFSGLVSFGLFGGNALLRSRWRKNL